MPELSTFPFYKTTYELSRQCGIYADRALVMLFEYAFHDKPVEKIGDPAADMFVSSQIPLIDAAVKKQRGGAPEGNQNAAGHSTQDGNNHNPSGKNQYSKRGQTTRSNNPSDKDKNKDKNERRGSCNPPSSLSKEIEEEGEEKKEKDLYDGFIGGITDEEWDKLIPI